MLNRVTSHCPNGHELVENDHGKRTKQIPASEVRDVRSIGWCDVCIEPFQDEERWSCAQCYYDCCWRCHDVGREGYVFTINFTSGSFEGYTVYGTTDVRKEVLDADALLTQAEDDIEAATFKSVLTFDCDIGDISFGADAKELGAIQDTGKVVYSINTGQMKKLSFSYVNPEDIVENDLRLYGISIGQFAVNSPHSGTPPDELKDNWAMVEYITLNDSGGHESTKSFGSISYRRFGLIEVPGFGMAEEQANKTIKLLREIATDKRKIINPMRQKTTSPAASMTSCFARFFPSAVSIENKFGPANNVIEKLQETDKSVKILDELTHEQENITYEVQISSGKVNHRDLIYASRLSLLAYLIEPIPFGVFFPAEREKYLLSPMWVNFIEHLDQNEGRELLRQWLGQNAKKQAELEAHAHEAFLAKFISTFFVSDVPETSENYGMSRPLNTEDGPLAALGLKYAPLFPDRKGKEGALQFGGTEGFIAVSDCLEQEGGDICIVFQGTNELRDLMVSFNGLTTPFEPLSDTSSAGSLACLQGRLVSDDNQASQATNYRRVHLGFYNAFLKMRDPIDKYIRETLAKIPKDKNVRIVVTGHSLGGALASMCTAWLFELFDEELKAKTSGRYPVIEGEITGKASDRLRILCLTFGAPKIGTKTFVTWMDGHKFLQKKSEGETVRAKILRLIDVMDPIVTLPPSGGVFQYLHTARRGATVAKDGTMVFISRTAADKYDETTRGLGVVARKGQRAIRNHDLFLYLHKSLHFAWVFNDVSEGDDWEESPLERAFGAANYRYDKFVRSPFFRTGF